MFLCLRSVFWGNGAGPGAGAPLSTSRCQRCRLTQVRRRRRQPPPPTLSATPLYRAVLLTPHPHSHHYNTYLINTFLTYPTPFLLLPLPANDLFTGTCGTRVSSHHVCARRGCWHMRLSVCDTLQTSQLRNLIVKIQLISFLDKNILVLAQIPYITHYNEKNYNYLYIDPLMRLQVGPTVNRRRIY